MIRLERLNVSVVAPDEKTALEYEAIGYERVVEEGTEGTEGTEEEIVIAKRTQRGKKDGNKGETKTK